MKHDYFRIFPEADEIVKTVGAKLRQYIADKKLFSPESLEHFTALEKDNQFYVFDLDEADVYDNVPELKDFLDRWNLSGRGKRTIAIICAPDISVADHGHIHCDCDRENAYARLVWPVQNCDGSVTKVFKFRDDFEWKLVKSRENTQSYIAFDAKDSDYEEVARYELVRPLLWYPYIPHGLYPNPNSKGHRISLALTIEDDLVKDVYNDPRLLDEMPK